MTTRGQHRPEELQELSRPYEKYYGERGPDQRRKTATVESMPKRQFQVQEIRDNHHEIIRRLVLGQKPPYIAKAVGCSSATVRNVQKSPVVRDRLGIMQASRDKQVIDVAAHIKRIAPKSIQLLENVIDGKVDGAEVPLSLRVRTAENNLDRAGHSATRKFQGAVGHFTSDDIASLKEEALRRCGPVVVS